MVLHEIDESAHRQVGAGFPALGAAAERRRIPLIRESFDQATDQLPDRLLGIVQIVPMALSRHQDMKDVMDVIVPLCIV
jgi:hypothetical protein